MGMPSRQRQFLYGGLPLFESKTDELPTAHYSSFICWNCCIDAEEAMLLRHLSTRSSKSLQEKVWLMGVTLARVPSARYQGAKSQSRDAKNKTCRAWLAWQNPWR